MKQGENGDFSAIQFNDDIAKNTQKAFAKSLTA